MASIALVVAGLALLPFLQTGLEPKRVSNDISISYNWYNAAPVTLESEVTSIVADVCSTIPGVRRISSFSQTNSGGITIEFVEEKNMDAARMEVSSMLSRAPRYIFVVFFSLLSTLDISVVFIENGVYNGNTSRVSTIFWPKVKDIALSLRNNFLKLNTSAARRVLLALPGCRSGYSIDRV